MQFSGKLIIFCKIWLIVVSLLDHRIKKNVYTESIVIRNKLSFYIPIKNQLKFSCDKNVILSRAGLTGLFRPIPGPGDLAPCHILSKILEIDMYVSENWSCTTLFPAGVTNYFSLHTFVFFDTPIPRFSKPKLRGKLFATVVLRTVFPMLTLSLTIVGLDNNNNIGDWSGQNPDHHYRYYYLFGCLGHLDTRRRARKRKEMIWKTNNSFFTWLYSTRDSDRKRIKNRRDAKAIT